MSKKKKALDRKTRRSLARAIKEGLNPSVRTENAASINLSGGMSYASRVSSITASSGWGTTNSKAPVELAPLSSGMFVSKFFADDHRLRMRTFQHLFPKVEFTVVRRMCNDDAYFSRDQYAFFNEHDLSTFETWMNEFLAKFDGHLDLDFPPPVDGIYPYAVRIREKPTSAIKTNKSGHITGIVLMSDYQFDQWCFILDNCQGEVRHSADFWFFADESDASLFKMAF